MLGVGIGIGWVGVVWVLISGWVGALAAPESPSIGGVWVGSIDVRSAHTKACFFTYVEYGEEVGDAAEEDEGDEEEGDRPGAALDHP